MKNKIKPVIKEALAEKVKPKMPVVKKQTMLAKTLKKLKT